jgi:beta-glucanase (GH16 family)
VSFASHSQLLAVACLLVFIEGGLGGVAQASVVTDNPAAWKLAFSDDFSGSSLDITKWAHRLPGVRNSAINTSNSVTVGGGLLTITTYTDGGTNYTGMIGTQGIFEQTYGYFEARMKFHSSPGEWSAFWLQSPTYGNPLGDPGQAGAEIDIVEHRATNSNGTTVSGRYVSAVHWDGYGDDHKQVAETHTSPGNLGNDTWHTYGLEWSANGYKFYYDDTLQWTVSEAVSRRSEYMILSSEVRDDNWAGSVPAGGYGSFASSVTNVQVDFVRVYAGMPGDFSGNGTVDAADYVLWRRGSGAIYSQTDYQNWKSHFGEFAGAGSGDAEGSLPLAAIPEPSTIVLLISASIGGFSKFASRKSSQNTGQI